MLLVIPVCCTAVPFILIVSLPSANLPLTPLILRWASFALLRIFCAVSRLSIGVFYLPTAIAALVAAIIRARDKQQSQVASGRLARTFLLSHAAKGKEGDPEKCALMPPAFECAVIAPIWRQWRGDCHIHRSQRTMGSVAAGHSRLLHGNPDHSPLGIIRPAAYLLRRKPAVQWLLLPASRTCSARGGDC